MIMTNLLSELPDKISKIIVDAGGQQSGILRQRGHFSFLYTDENHPVSLTMPYSHDPYNYGALHPVFTQSLPEGYLRRYIHEKLRRYADVDDLYLLALMGGKGIGHLAYKSDINLPTLPPINLSEILHWSGKDKLFPQLLESYYLGGMAAGVQPKVVIERSALLQPDLIIKTFDEEYPLLTVNEYVCMKCAQYCGLSTPNVWLSDNLEHYIIERFDIDESGNKIGIEDYATLMGMAGDKKYNGSYENVLKATLLNTKSNDEVLNAFTLIAFNCLIGNGDAHLKNFSLQYSTDMTNIMLSPVYDITHTIIYPTVDNDMALKLKKSKLFPNRKDLIDLAFDAGISRSKAVDIIDNMAQNIQQCLETLTEVEAMPNLKLSIISHLNKVMVHIPIAAPYRHKKKKKFE
jgi:serine/threonine-protein kinase HipA